MIRPMTATATTAEPGSRSTLQGRLLVFAALILSAFTLRAAVTSVSPLFPRIGDDLGFGAGAIGLLGMLPTAMFALFGVLTPVIATRLGLERTALAAAALTGVGIFARAFAPGLGSLALLSAVALAGMGIGNVVIPPLVKRYFSDRLAMMSTVYICLLQLGTIVPSLTAVPVADAVGWRWSLAMWGVAAVAAVVPWTAIVLTRRTRPAAPAVRGAESPAQDAAVEAELDGPLTEPSAQPVAPPVPVWRTSLGWGMAGMFAMTSMVTYSMLTWLPSLLVEAGISEGAAGASLGVFAAVGLAGSLLAPSFTSRMVDPYPIVIGCAVCYLAGFAGLLWAPATGTVLWLILVGAGPTTFPMSLTLINLRTRTAVGSASLSGFTQGVGYTIACAGPILFGVLHENTGGWEWSFAFLTCGIAVLLVAAKAACRPRVLEDGPVRQAQSRP